MSNINHTIKVKARCAHKSAAGRQCSQITEMTHPYCAKHTLSELGFWVAKSKVPNAGLGLFTNNQYKKGDVVVEYAGEVISQKEYNERYDKEGYGEYGMTLGKNKVIDARKTSAGLGRYICDSYGSDLKKNVQYEEHDKKIEVVAIRKINPGDELLVSYGKEIRISMGIQQEKEKKKKDKKKKKKK
jgi:uncharacterized protein